MNDILALQQIDLVQWFVDALLIIVACTAIFNIIGKFSEIVGKPFKWVKKKNQDHELLLSLSKRFVELSEIHERDMQASDKNDEQIKNSLDNFIKESTIRNEQVRNDLHDSINEMKEIVDKVYEDNMSYRDKSREIRSGMDGKIDNIVEGNRERDVLIRAIADGIKELSGDKIDQKFEKYYKLNGIPANEVDEFESMCQAYFALNGNHNRKKKYDYVKKMDVIPVKTDLILHDK